MSPFETIGTAAPMISTMQIGAALLTFAAITAVGILVGQYSKAMMAIDDEVSWHVSLSKMSFSSVTNPQVTLAAILGAMGALLSFSGLSGAETLTIALSLSLAHAIATFDWHHGFIPDELTWLLLFIGLLASPIEPDQHSRVLAGALCAASLWALMSISGMMRGVDTRAWADVAMAAAIGAWVGLERMPYVCIAACALHILLAKTVHNSNFDDEETGFYPFGPSAMSALIAVMLLSLMLPAEHAVWGM